VFFFFFLVKICLFPRLAKKMVAINQSGSNYNAATGTAIYATY